MAFRFIHTADWQIGKAFGQFGVRLGERLRMARLDAIDRIANHARTEQAAHVLVAGDTWDHQRPANETLHNTLERLGQHDAVTWWLLPGNHDPAHANGLWTLIQDRNSFALPSNVKLLLEAAPVAIADNVVLLPAPLQSFAPGHDPTEWMVSCATPDGSIRIGIAHGGVAGFGGEGESEAVIDPARANNAKLDYLALGDWHGKKQAGDRTWYAGTPEPDRFRNNDPGWCLSVSIARPGAKPNVKALATADYCWSKVDLTVRPGMTAADIFAAALPKTGSAQKTLLDLTLTGRIRAGDLAELTTGAARIADTLAHLDLSRDDLRMLAEGDDLDRLGASGALRATAELLLAKATDEQVPAPRRQDADHALALLFAFAAETPDGAAS